MNFAFTPDQLRIQQMVKDLVAKEVAPNAKEWDKGEDFTPIYKMMKEKFAPLGLMGLPGRPVEAVIAQGNYVEVHGAGGRYLQREPLHVFAERLGSDFMRVHRSALVRADAVRAVTSLGSSRYALRLRSGIEVESGRSYAETVRRLLAFKA